MKAKNKRVPARSVAFVAIALFISAWFFTGVEKAKAHDPATYYPNKWASDPLYAFGYLGSPLNTDTAKTSLHAGDDPWDAVTDAWLDFNWSGNENPHVMWLGDTCSTEPSNGVWILSDDISVLGLTGRCLSGGNIIKATIRLDDVGSNWYTGSATTVPTNKTDLRSTIIHEFGHAGGFAGHFSGSTLCSGSTRQTMCSAIPLGTSYMRTLEEHDKHTFAAAY